MQETGHVPPGSPYSDVQPWMVPLEHDTLAVPPSLTTWELVTSASSQTNPRSAVQLSSFHVPPLTCSAQSSAPPALFGSPELQDV